VHRVVDRLNLIQFVGQAGNVVTQAPFTHPPFAHDAPPFGHARQICGTAQPCVHSVLVVPPVDVAPPALAPPVPVESHGGMWVVHLPSTHAPVAHDGVPFGHCAQIAGTAQSFALVHSGTLVVPPPEDAPPAAVAPPAEGLPPPPPVPPQSAPLVTHLPPTHVAVAHDDFPSGHSSQSVGTTQSDADVHSLEPPAPLPPAPVDPPAPLPPVPSQGG
jgi:hypothetical protein